MSTPFRALISAAFLTPLIAVADVPRLRAVRLGKPPIIDGEVGEDEWREVPKLSGFVDPFTDKPPVDNTEAWIGYNDAGIYVAFRCVDSAPNQMVAREIRPGAFFDGEDTVTVKLNPFGTRNWDGRSRFTVNLLNTQSEEISGEGPPSASGAASGSRRPSASQTAGRRKCTSRGRC